VREGRQDLGEIFSLENLTHFLNDFVLNFFW
jgi:hypothetical protein